MANDRPLAYDIVQKQVGTPPVLIGFIKSECASCGRVEELAWRAHHNPHHISNHYKQLGWDYDVYRKPKIKCPDCKTAKPAKKTKKDDDLPVLKTFGARFRYYREQAKLKRDDIAEQAGIKPRLLEWLELDQEHPFRLASASMDKLIQILVSHDVPVDRAWLLDLPGQSATLAKNLRAAMEANNFIEGSLAEKSHVPLSQIKLLLSGAIHTHYRLPELARLLRTTPEQLMGVPESHNGYQPPAKIEPANNPESTAERLRETRKANDLTQRRLAERIHQHTQQWTIDTLIWMISRVERGAQTPGETVLLAIAADVLNVRIDWLLGRSDNPLPDIPLPVPSMIPETEAVEMRQQLAKLEGDISGLDAMLKETKAVAGFLRERLGTSVAVLKPVPEPIIKAPVPAILVANANGNGHGHNGHEHNGQTYHHPGEIIDRGSDSKQNMFARALIGVRGKLEELTVPEIENCLKTTLSRVINPAVTDTHDKRRAYVHALMRRETVADNGLLKKTGRGCWRFREGATI